VSGDERSGARDDVLVPAVPSAPAGPGEGAAPATSGLVAGADPGGPPAAALRAFVEELVRAGVREAVVCPGSRSTPIALALAADPAIRVLVSLDERAGSFLALGMAKAARRPVAFLATSGTAVVNAHPAVVEAFHGRVPLVVLTADRPPELRDRGAAQTIDQVDLYGTATKWSVDMPVPEAGPAAEDHWRSVASRAAAVAAQEPAGPVHVNLPFREPLVPDGDLRPAVGATGGEASSGDAYRQERSLPAPHLRLLTGDRRLDAGRLAALADDIAAARRPLIVCGPIDEPDLAPAVARLAVALDAPVVADPLSQLRSGPHDRSRVIARGDLLARPGAWAAAHAPDLVIRLGAPPTSRALLQLVEGSGAAQVVVDGGDGWLDPTTGPTTFVHAAPRGWCLDLAFLVPEARAARASHGAAAGTEPGWTEAWLAGEAAVDLAVRDRLARIDEPYEGRLLAVLDEVLPSNTLLWVGSSMPVRDLDAYAPGGERRIRVLSNRGANGIDGVVSSALGAAAVHAGPAVLALGDVSFLHDLDGLLAARLHDLSLAIVLIDNDGGGIFSFLPQARTDAPGAGLPERFEALFGTPHGMGPRLGPVVEAFGCRWIDLAAADDGERADDPGTRDRPTGSAGDEIALRAALGAAIGAAGVTVVRYPADRARNLALHRDVAAAVATALDALVDRAAPRGSGS
jgi:2-succinyl-5-enolpyruvyl-6-hydroxy-3-cyclohexene-1-carboxylate synthase